MKTVALTRASAEMQRILQAARKEDVVLRTAEGDEALLTWIDEFAYEIAAQRRNKKLMAFLDRCAEESRKEKAIPLEEVERRLGLPARTVNGPPPTQVGAKPITISGRARGMVRLLAEARAEVLLLQSPNGHEYALIAIRGGDRVKARHRLSDAVMAYLDSLPDSQLPPLEVSFRQSPRHASRSRVSK